MGFGLKRSHAKARLASLCNYCFNAELFSCCSRDFRPLTVWNEFAPDGGLRHRMPASAGRVSPFLLVVSVGVVPYAGLPIERLVGRPSKRHTFRCTVRSYYRFVSPQSVYARWAVLIGYSRQFGVVVVSFGLIDPSGRTGQPGRANSPCVRSRAPGGKWRSVCGRSRPATVRMS